MKFTFPFLKKKSDPLAQQEVEKAVEQDMEALSPPKIDWESIGRSSFIPPSSPIQSNPADGMASFEGLDLPPMRQAVVEPENNAKTFTAPDKSTATTSNSMAAEPEDEVIPTPVKVAPQASAPAPMETVKPTPQSETKPESQPVAKPATQPVAKPESQPPAKPATQPINQPATQAVAQPFRMTKEDVIAAYKIFLNRLPESTAVMNLRIGGNVEANLIDFVLAEEFLKRPEVSPLILGLAKQIIERQKASGLPIKTSEEGKKA
jgi:hypothetical protein